MPHINVYIPDELTPIAKDLSRFWSAMVYKLRKNKHKGKWEDLSLSEALLRMVEEVGELKQAMHEQSYAEILLEGADIANFAMIITSVALDELPDVKEDVEQ